MTGLRGRVRDYGRRLARRALPQSACQETPEHETEHADEEDQTSAHGEVAAEVVQELPSSWGVRPTTEFMRKLVEVFGEGCLEVRY